jgi:hypothetical protein
MALQQHLSYGFALMAESGQHLTKPNGHLIMARARLVITAMAIACLMSGPTAVAAASGVLPVGRSYTGAPPVPAPGACHARGVFPDPRCTPGATNPVVTQSDIASTICAPGWPSSVRPPESYTEPLKRRLMASYGDKYAIRDYELDHLVSLELGGAPSDPRNLWPEFGASPNPKDRVEDAAHKAVCDHKLSLAIAQIDIATNWVSLAERLGLGDLAAEVPKPGGVTSSTPTTGVPVRSGGVSNKSPTGHYYKPGEFCPMKDLGKTITGPYGTMKCELKAGERQPHWVRAP